MNMPSPIVERVPHGAPMLLLDDVLEATPERCRARMTVDAAPPVWL